ncbi:hypothetical protein BJ973_002384 [Actinoplanes tereljensis]|uniref:DUF5666 domain-containing protein n=1 Tax=Paractinoplanes tereljensis TaxID=571912 RepID=A0A919TVK9_9ACTN|nr:hypothetical protein [Actinoplanes tereljensis]GIF22057.1 hypothetical protein Ate02nite_47870 [Actinoplanes tereljensis]
MTDSDTEVREGVTEEPPEDEDLPDRLSKAAPRKWFNRATPTLLCAFLLAGGFLGGVAVQKHWGKASSAATATSSTTRTGGGMSGQMPGGAGASGFPGGGFGGNTGGNASAGNATTGTIKSITTTALTMTTAAGKTVTVKIADSTKIQQTTTLAKLKAGQSLSVQGTTATDGAITATTLTAS